MALADLRREFDGLFAGTGGIDSWISATTPPTVGARLATLEANPLPREQFNQLLVLSHEAGVSAGFFAYYWLTTPDHPYDVTSVEDFDDAFLTQKALISLPHLRWGLRRFYTDALLFFGNVRSAYRALRDYGYEELQSFFGAHRYDTASLAQRGAPLPLRSIPRDDRFLVAERARSSLASPDGGADLGETLRENYRKHAAAGNAASVSIAELIAGAPPEQHEQLRFTAEEMLEDEVSLDDALSGAEEVDAKIAALTQRFDRARGSALHNTSLYLSMVADLDVYIATSMGKRQDFRDIADFCQGVFDSSHLEDFDVRYFDPTMSAADGHEDKGLIECLMVKSAKVLIWYAGDQDSYGKDAEAAMALSQGKPVICYCDNPDRRHFLRDIHPLGRLIDFDTGVANGWMVASSLEQVAELLARTLRNEMRYRLRQPKEGYLTLEEELTGSVVRLQTNDELLRETFWNYYHRDRRSPIR